MGSVFGCLRADDDERSENSNTSENSITPARSSCLARQIINVYISLFRREEIRIAPSSEQETTPFASTSFIGENSAIDTYHPPPRPLPFDDPRCSQLQHDKGSTHFHQVSQPDLDIESTSTATHFHQVSQPDLDIESTSTAKLWSRSDYEGGPKIFCSESSLKHPSTEVASAVMFSSSEDEDVCPVCLEEYTYGNPRIIMQCTHHFHLGCIFEWMERSGTCPVCDKVMIFDETT